MPKPNKENFLKALDQLQESSAEAKHVPSWHEMALHTFAEVIHLGFLIEASHLPPQVPKEVVAWADEANHYAVNAKNALKVPAQVPDKMYEDFKKVVNDGRHSKALGINLKATSHLQEAAKLGGV
jgi:hypothetical protein